VRERIIIRRNGPGGGPMVMHGGPGMVMMQGGRWDVLGGLSADGQKIMREAMRPQRPTEADQSALRAARDRALSLIAAEKLDIAAIRKAQAEERAAAMAQHARQQEAMLAAYQKLSAADRKAFVDGMRGNQDRMRDALKKARERLDEMEKRLNERAKSGDVRELFDEMQATPISYGR
jgi:Spy/CpxP family protein refolding chaperone